MGKNEGSITSDQLFEALKIIEEYDCIPPSIVLHGAPEKLIEIDKSLNKEEEK